MSKGLSKLSYRRGVGAVLFNKWGLAFVGRRIDTQENAWQFPQGGIDRGENPRQAILRELQEEIGTNEVHVLAETRNWYSYDIPSSLVPYVWGGKFKGQKQRWFALRLIDQENAIDIAASSKPEFDAWKWVPLEEAPGMVIAFKRPLYERLVEEFSPIARELAKTAHE